MKVSEMQYLSKIWWVDKTQYLTNTIWKDLICESQILLIHIDAFWIDSILSVIIIGKLENVWIYVS